MDTAEAPSGPAAMNNPSPITEVAACGLARCHAALALTRVAWLRIMMPEIAQRWLEQGAAGFQFASAAVVLLPGATALWPSGDASAQSLKAAARTALERRQAVFGRLKRTAPQGPQGLQTQRVLALPIQKSGQVLGALAFSMQPATGEEPSDKVLLE